MPDDPTRPGDPPRPVHRPRRAVIEPLDARALGDVDFDTEGLSDAQEARRASTRTLVLMLQPPEGGGGLRVWDRRWQGEADDEAIEEDAVSSAVAEAHVADLTVIDSYTL